MEVARPATAGEALAAVEGPLAAAGAEGELCYGILLRLVGEPAAWGEDVTILVGSRGGAPVALVTMTGDHPALIVGLGGEPDIDFAALVDVISEQVGA